MVVVKQKGFSLIELLIVVAIILILAAIAIPNLIAARAQANEASAVNTLRAIGTAQVSYNSSYPTVGYATNLAALGPPPSGQSFSSTYGGFLDQFVGCAAQPCLKSGYSFQIVNASGTPVDYFEGRAIPLQQGTSGRRGFCLTNLNQITFDPTGGTTCTTMVQ